MPLVVTSLGAVTDVGAAIQDYGGIVLHDVVSRRHAEKAIEAGVDGLVLLTSGSGGHTGGLNPFAFLAEVRTFYDGIVALAGGVGDGRGIAAAQIAGADLVYMGTRFIATAEANATDAYKDMIVEATTADIVVTDAVSGVPCTFLKASLERNGFPTTPSGSAPRYVPADQRQGAFKAWKDIWSAGQGVGGILDAPATAALVDRLEQDYVAALAEAAARLRPSVVVQQRPPILHVARQWGSVAGHRACPRCRYAEHALSG